MFCWLVVRTVPLPNLRASSAMLRSCSAEGALSPLQDAFCEAHGLQCGYCTPGMLIAAQALLDATPHPTEEQIREAIGGNLCRCTGYAQIVEAVLLAAERSR